MEVAPVKVWMARDKDGEWSFGTDSTEGCGDDAMTIMSPFTLLGVNRILPGERWVAEVRITKEGR